MEKRLPLIVFPPEVIERIKFMCEAEGLGMSAITNDAFAIILVGRNELPPNVAHLLVAQTLISGILSGCWEIENNSAEERKEEGKPM